MVIGWLPNHLVYQARRSEYLLAESSDSESRATTAGYRPLDHVQLTVPARRRTAAAGTDARDFQAVAFHAEAVFGGDLLQDLLDFRILELGQLAALFADEVNYDRPHNSRAVEPGRRGYL